MSAGGEHINYKELYEASLQMNQQLLKSKEALQSQLLTVQHQLQQLTKLLKGFKSERFVPSGAPQPQKELGLLFEEAAASTNLADVQKISYTKVKKQPVAPEPQKGLPAELKRIVTIIEPKEDVSHCEKVGEEIIETLDYQPGELIVNRTVIPQYRCAAIDNNAIERCMRTVAIGRKNYLFCGSHDAAKRAGRLYSLLVTCKLNDVNPYDWLKDVLSQNLQEMHINKIKELLPHIWKKNRQQTIIDNTTA